MFTLRLPWKRLYIVTSPEVVAAIDRQPKTLSFGPLAIEFTKRIAMPSKQAHDVLTEDFLAGKGTRSFYADRVRTMNAALGPGLGLENTIADMLSSSLQLLDSTYAPTRNPEVDLFSWTKSLVTQISTNAVYGSRMNPFKDPLVESSLW